MKRYIFFLIFLCFLLMFGLPLTSVAQDSERHTIVDPLTVSGTVGTQLTSSWNNVDLHYNTPFSTTAYANMIFNVYGVSIPMSVNYINTSAEQFNFSDPIFTINFKPVWKKFTFHFGTSSMNFSNYTYNGISFNGVGVEYRGDFFRFGGFYGTFNRATRLRTRLDDRSALQFLSDSLLGLNNVDYMSIPQLERKAYAAHIALGSKRNYLDFSFIHAADKIDTILMVLDTTLKGKENLAMGVKGHFTIGKGVTFETNLGASLYTPDITQDTMVLKGISGAGLVNKLTGELRKFGVFDARFGSEVRFAGDALLNFKFNPVNATLTYRFVQPDYISLGANGFNQNAQTFGGRFSTSLFNQTAFLSLNGYLQRDNLDKKQLYTNQVGSYTASWSNFFGEHVALALLYNGVTQKQLDGVEVVSEKNRINQITHSIDVSPSYTLSLDNDHTFSLNFNLLQNKNRNEQMEGMRFDVTTTSYGLGYEVYLAEPRVSIDANYDYSLSRSPGNDYNSHCISGGTTYNIIEKDNLSLSGNARLTMAYNVEKTETEELSDAERQDLDYLAHRLGREAGSEMTNDVSLAARLGATLNYKDRHNASVFFSISNYSDNIIIGQHVAVNTDVRFMVEYSYTFASRLIRSKKSR
jgi:hypothetical protein